ADQQPTGSFNRIEFGRFQNAEIMIGPRSSELHHGKSAHQIRKITDADAGYREILDRTLRMNSKQRLGRKGAGAEHVSLGPQFGTGMHCHGGAGQSCVSRRHISGALWRGYGLRGMKPPSGVMSMRILSGW